MSRVLNGAAIAVSLLLVGCPSEDPGGDGGLDGGGVDAGPVGTSCTGESDGTACGTGLICVGEDCVEAGCGDGYVDGAAGEACDDGNDIAFDGCEPSTCAYTCDADSQCDDGRECNGTEVCDPEMHVCALGAPAGEGSPCDIEGTGDGVCRGTECVDPGCGNGVTDGAEQCDDGNDVDGDGCDTDCTYSCVEDMDCIDGDVCNGAETCDTATHQCVPGTALDCADGDACTADECHPSDGCSNPLIDMDGDGHAASSLGACGDDCDDSRPDVFTGAEELCDGVDNNCNVDVDEIAPTWYVDCDADGFSPDTSVTRTGCTEPPASATGCPSGGRWTTVRPNDRATTDCHDANANVFPGQTMYFASPYSAADGSGSTYDYNCDGAQSASVSCIPDDAACARDSRGCSGSAGYPFGECDLSCTSGGTFPICFYVVPCGATRPYSACGTGLCFPRPCTPPCIRLNSNRQQTCR